jgi:hypothetical protein
MKQSWTPLGVIAPALVPVPPGAVSTGSDHREYQLQLASIPPRRNEPPHDPSPAPFATKFRTRSMALLDFEQLLEMLKML